MVNELRKQVYDKIFSCLSFAEGDDDPASRDAEMLTNDIMALICAVRGIILLTKVS